MRQYTLAELIEQLKALKEAPVHPEANIPSGKGHVFVKVVFKNGAKLIRRDIKIEDQGSFLTIEIHE